MTTGSGGSGNSDDIFAPFSDLLARAGKARAEGSPFDVCFERVVSPVRAWTGGREVLLAGTNNYLGLTFAPECQEAVCRAVTEGVGTTGSRIANGTHALHRELERRLAAFYGKKRAMVFSTGYQANLGLLSTLMSTNTRIFMDADSHASIHDGLGLGGNRGDVICFRHNDTVDLERRLARIPDRRGPRLIVVEGVYSMLGDRAPLKEIVRISRKYGAYLYVDEAHSMGVYGRRGRGICEVDDVIGDCDLIVGTFSKSLGSVGGFCVSDREELEALRLGCRAYMFSASLPPTVIAGALAALEIVDSQRGQELRQTLQENADVLHRALSGAGMTLGSREPAPVIGVVMPDTEVGLAFWRRLMARGVYVNLALPPATPGGKVLLRCSLCACHSPADIQEITSAILGVAQEVGVLHGLAAE